MCEQEKGKNRFMLFWQRNSTMTTTSLIMVLSSYLIITFEHDGFRTLIAQDRFSNLQTIGTIILLSGLSFLVLNLIFRRFRWYRVLLSIVAFMLCAISVWEASQNVINNFMFFITNTK